MSKATIADLSAAGVHVARGPLSGNVVFIGKRQPTEDQLQIYSADVFRTFKRPGVVGFHVPNGGVRHPATAKRLKAMGTRPGVSDWIFIIPGGHVRCLELKDHKGRQSPDQIEFQAEVEACGIPYAIARTPDEIDGVLSAFGVIDKPSSPRASASDLK